MLCWTGGPLVIAGSPLPGAWWTLLSNPAVHGVLLALLLWLLCRRLALEPLVLQAEKAGQGAEEASALVLLGTLLSLLSLPVWGWLLRVAAPGAI